MTAPTSRGGEPRADVFPALPDRSGNGLTIRGEGGTYRVSGTREAYLYSEASLAVEPGERLRGYCEQGAGNVGAACYAQDRIPSNWPDVLSRGKDYVVPEGSSRITCGVSSLGPAGVEVDAWFRPHVWRVG